MDKKILLIGLIFSTSLFSGCSTKAETPHSHKSTSSKEENRVEATCVDEGSYDLVVYCDECGEELLREHKIIEPLGHDLINHAGQEATLEEDGYFPYVTCSRCDYSTYTTIHKKSLPLNEKTYITELPSLSIDVNGAHIPDRSDPEYSNYCPGTLTFNDGVVNIEDIAGKVRIRGTSSRWFNKKGYKIKFSEKLSIYGLPKSKKYNLLASYLDPTLLRDYLAMQISYDMNTFSDRYAPTIKPIKVYLDNVYQGIYYLIDDIDGSSSKINLKDSKDINKTSFILEMDTLAHREGTEGVNYFVLGTTDVFDYDGSGHADLEYKLDTPEVVTETQFDFIEDYICDCRSCLANKDLDGFKNLVDVNSFIDFFLLAELFRNTDLAGRSTYLYLRDVSEKLTFGPSWDFDYTCSRPYQLGPNQDYTLDNATDRFTDFDWWSLFLEIEGAEELIKSRYTNYFKPIVSYELNEGKRYFDAYSSLLNENATIWYNEVGDTNQLITDNYDWTFSYFEVRTDYYDSLFLL